MVFSVVQVVCLLQLLGCVSFTSASASGAKWTYTGPKGVDHWPQISAACGGSAQSPVDIQTHAVVRQRRPRAFHFHNFNRKSVTWMLENNGHSAELILTSGDLWVSGGGLPVGSKYKVKQLHFHWGANDSYGSEHTINGRRFPMEIHVVTFKKSYTTISNALNHPDGLAVFSLLFEVSKDPEDNSGYRRLVSVFGRIRNPGTTYTFGSMALGRLLPVDVDQYYRYKGSLTTPPCTEVVTWTLFSEPIEISRRQLRAFRQLLSSEKDSTGAYKPLVDNFRPVQPLNGRTVKFFKG